jgi:hypothetical protein
MAEAIAAPAPVVPTPTAAPQGAPAVEVKPTPAPSAPDAAQRLKALEEAHRKKVVEHIVERRKWEASQKANGEKMARLEAMEKREAMARLNPPEFLKGLYGDNWYDKVVESKLNGVPPGDLIQAELAARDAKWEARFAEREKSTTEAATAAQQRQVESARRGIQAEAGDWYAKAGATSHPILEGLGDAAAVSRILAHRIEANFHATTVSDESGEVLRQGRVLSPAEMADVIEGELLAVAERATGAEKYKARFAPKASPLQTQPSGGSVGGQGKQQPSASGQQSSTGQQRRTLSNNLTGSTSEAKPARITPDDRRSRALAALKATRRSATGE